MPAEDLLQFIGEPVAFSRWWLVLGVLGIVAVIAWCVGVHLWTRGVRPPAVQGVQTWRVRRRFSSAVREVGDRYRSGALTSAEASAELNRTVRSFLAAATGAPVPFMHLSEIADSATPLVVGSTPLLKDLTSAQFDPAVEADVAALQRQAEELIAQWN